MTIAANVGSPQVTIASNVVTINPAADLDATGMQYTVTMPSGAFTDGTNEYVGLSGNAYRFTVADTTAPTLVSKVPGCLAPVSPA